MIFNLLTDQFKLICLWKLGYKSVRVDVYHYNDDKTIWEKEMLLLPPGEDAESMYSEQEFKCASHFDIDHYFDKEFKNIIETEEFKKYIERLVSKELNKRIKK